MAHTSCNNTFMLLKMHRRSLFISDFNNKKQKNKFSFTPFYTLCIFRGKKNGCKKN